MNEKLMTIKDVAEFMQVSVITARRMIARNQIPHIRVGSGRGSIRVTPEQIQEYIKRKSEDNNGTSN